ncbi:MAG: M28 family peptidase [Chloroflexi bacterium]|nr:M28 family peptidase [Chloroflexota bacterium]MBU1752213.1 M28 family peptidase [Chloroflexota bacterium]MBU1879492.1 M28 family peptidase [Chloroflexota bacterium]
MTRNTWLAFGIIAVLAVLTGIVIYALVRPLLTQTSAGGELAPASPFDGQRAYQDVLAQCDIGPRPAGSEGNARCAAYIIDQLRGAGWAVETQEFVYQGVQCRNVIAKAGPTGGDHIVLLGAHFDTRLYADHDPDQANWQQPVMGANDGASGVAVLLELARTLGPPPAERQVWLAFFDAEDNGQINGWPFCVGSSYMAEHLSQRPNTAIIVDMIGDADQQLHYERTSNQPLNGTIWDVAAKLGYDKWFVPQPRHSLWDDHTAFLRQGITAIDIIDFDYPYWHTVQDTADKVSPASLERVGRVLQAYILGAVPGQ